MEEVKAKITSSRPRLKELEQKHREAENEEIVDIVRGMSVTLDELPALLRQFRGRALWTRCPEARRGKGGDLMKKSRMLASTLCAVLMVGVLTVPAYAGGGGESEGSEYVPWVGLEPVDPLPVEQPPEPQPFTSDGTGTVVDNATDEDGKEFFTITTADEAVFYLVIDRQRSTENVYFLNAVTVSDLMALAEQDQEPEAPPPVTEPDPEPEPDPAPEPEPQKSGGARDAPGGPGGAGPGRRGRVVLQDLPPQAAAGGGAGGGPRRL